MSQASNAMDKLISLPQGGGALSGIGEKFSPDLHTGTGNFTVPIVLPPGRNGFQPHLNLVYSTGNGNGPFGLGWNLSIPGVSRKTSDGVPLYNESAAHLSPGERRDVFILSGTEDLVPISGGYPGEVVYLPRTEGLFARMTHHRKVGSTQRDYWRVESKDGRISLYGSTDPADGALAVLAKPGDPWRIFAWNLAETIDPFGNRIRYEYEADSGDRGNQLLLKGIRYVNYGDDPSADIFLIHVDLSYEDRPDPFSNFRAGFEIRTTRRCSAIQVSTHTGDGQVHPVREYRFTYAADPDNSVSLLERLEIIGYDDADNAHEDDNPDGEYPRQLPPLTFGYTRFAPEARKFQVLAGRDLPSRNIGAPGMALVDLYGGGLPDILEMNGSARYWRNLGDGSFDHPRPMADTPPFSLADPSVQMLDADGDGRMDLLIAAGPAAGYFPMEHGARWSRESFRPYSAVPSFPLDDPNVELVDLTGDGRTDILRSGSRLEAYFNDPDPALAWKRTRFAERKTLDTFPNVDFSDPRVRLADMTGDGLSDIVLLHDGNVEYWPNLGHNRWGGRITMRHAPRFPYGYDPKCILLGDVDGDGLADIVYVDYGRVMLWLNQSGNRWRETPIMIRGTPAASSMDDVRLIDLHGTGVSGLLWSSDAGSPSPHRWIFLDFTGGVKPYVLNEMDNHMGAVTRVAYSPSTRFFLEDEKHPDTRWRTSLPFPVQVVAKVEVIDEVSKGKLTTEYRYRHGYWDGGEREFRGFGRVEQLDTESFEDYHDTGLTGDAGGFKPVSEKHFSPPTLTRTWFHQGPVGEAHGDWREVDYTYEYWDGDPQLLRHTEQIEAFLGRYNDRGEAAMPSPGNRRIKRDALRTLRGSILRQETYALDGSPRQDRPYTVSEHAYDLKEVAPPVGPSERRRVFFSHPVAQRTTHWERGDDPMTQFAFTSDYDAFGQPHQQSAVTVPRLVRHQRAITGAVVGDVPGDQINQSRFLATHRRTDYAQPQPGGPYIHDRIAEIHTYERNTPPPGPDVRADSIPTALRKQADQARQIHDMFQDDTHRRLIGHELRHYDDLPVGDLGLRGALTRRRSLVFTAAMLDEAYGDRRPPYLNGVAVLPANAPAGFGADIGYQPEAGGYYLDALRQHHSPLGLPIAMWDARGHETVIEYDPHHLLPVKVTDAKGMSVEAAYNMRLLQPESMTEPNGTSTHVRYTPIGLPERQFLVGLDMQGNASLGGTEAHPDIRYDYGFREFEAHGRPVYVHTTRRVDHLSDAMIASREYSDGFGRLIQTRSQAEDRVYGELGGDVGLPVQPGSVPTSAIDRREDDGVTVSGWQRFDNKGRVIEKYEPFFSIGWAFQPKPESVWGRHGSLYYDPRGQVIRTLNPDGSQNRVIFGRPADPGRLGLTVAGLPSTDAPDGFLPTPWERYTYDANDLAFLTHPVHADVPVGHHFTPGSVVLDGLGRAVCAVARNGASAADRHITRSTYDIRGNLLVVTDTLGREAFTYQYDLLDRALRVDSIDAGLRTSVFDASGNLIETRDSRGSLTLRTYDELNRPGELWARNDAGGAFTLRERIRYGDEGDRAAARRHHTLGRPVKHYDEAGIVEIPEYDFKGNLLEKSRRTIRDSALENDWIADWSAPDAEDDLEDMVYRTSSRYDALNRPTEIIYPRDVDGERKKLTPRYNRAGALEAVRLGNDDYVNRISYNAKGQRVLIAYGNGLMIRYTYDADTFRLARLRTERFLHDTHARVETFSGIGPPVQDFSYRYDLVGNITQIGEHTPNSGIAGSPHGRDRLLREFSYDPIYRLLSATGRACKDIGAPRPLSDDPRCGFYAGGPATPSQDNTPDLTERYAERFSYDPAGNMLELAYHAVSGDWKRVFGMGGLPPARWQDAPNNRLTSLETGSATHGYAFDANGNLLRQNSDKQHRWDHADRMVGYRVQPSVSSLPSIQARYLYGADGMRVKKWVRNQQGQVTTTTYIDGIFEQNGYRTANEDRANNTLHVMDDQRRIALIRVGQPLDARDVSPRVKYHLGDHLGGSHVVVGGDRHTASTFISREEYSPYGETSLGSFGLKRYRYSGKERDEESGLYCYGVRYLAPWLGRWMSCDPIGGADMTNLYAAFNCNPISWVDDIGTQSLPVDRCSKPETDQWQPPPTTIGPISEYDRLRARPFPTPWDRWKIYGEWPLSGDLLGEALADQHFQAELDKYARQQTSKEGNSSAESIPAVKEFMDAISKLVIPEAHAGEGYTYRLENPATGGQYGGSTYAENLLELQRTFASRVDARAKEWGISPGQVRLVEVVHIPDVKSQKDIRLRVAEETQVRRAGGPWTHGGTGYNRRPEVPHDIYLFYGGTEPLNYSPTRVPNAKPPQPSQPSTPPPIMMRPPPPRPQMRLNLTRNRSIRR